MTQPGIKKKNIGYPTDCKDLILFISFPRTGSHFVRNFLELLIQRPCHPEASFYPLREPWGKHCHATEGHPHYIGVPKADDYKGMIYLDRKNLTRVIFSLIKFYDKQLDENTIKFYTKMYLDHKKKWLTYSKYLPHRIIYYEDFICKNIEVIQNLTQFINHQTPSKKQIYQTFKFLTKEKVKEITPINANKVVRLDEQYEIEYEDNKIRLTEIITEFKKEYYG